VQNIMQPYITKDEPFGPIDSAMIASKNVDALAKLFEFHNRIYRNMRNRPSIILGRKGSGKTSYLRSVYFENNYHQIIEIRTEQALMHISSVIQELTKGKMFPEMLAELWETILWVCVMARVRNDAVLIPDRQNLVNMYLDKVGITNSTETEDVLWKIAGIFDAVMAGEHKDGFSEILRRFDRASFKNTTSAVLDSLESGNKRIAILMDSLDDFHLEIESVSDSLKGLLKFVGSMNRPDAVVDIRFCLPTELYQRIRKISSNPNKDFQHSLKLQWKASELILIGAQRLMMYLEIYYPDYLKRLMPIDPSVRSDAIKLFQAVLPPRITNRSGYQEETISYILRHTQLLPRHFLILLNSIFKSTGGTTGLHPFPINEKRIINGIQQVEERIVGEIFTAFDLIHPSAGEACKRTFPALKHKFSVGELHRAFTQHGRAVYDGEGHFDFRRMLLEIGAIGRVTQQTEYYIQGEFEYTVERETPISPDDEMCIHPLFSGVFGNDRDGRG